VDGEVEAEAGETGGEAEDAEEEEEAFIRAIAMGQAIQGADSKADHWRLRIGP
jgi:hypothetical protein